MSNATKQFHLSALLTITTGRLMPAAPGGENGMSQVYEILGWMANDTLWTHQLPRVADGCKPWLLRWYPELAAESDHVEASLAGITKENADEMIAAYLMAARQRGCCETYMVPRMPQDDHVRKHPIDEAIEMRGSDHGVIALEL